MINSKPNNSNYHQGNYIPTNKDKVIKLNNQGGVYFRSSLERKLMIYLDNNPDIIRWASESIEIPYISEEYANGEVVNKQRRYYPDFYYEINTGGNIKRVIAEVKPKSEVDDVNLLKEGNFKLPEKYSFGKLKSLKYKFELAKKNLCKFETMIEYCKQKGMTFIIITDELLNNFK